MHEHLEADIHDLSVRFEKHEEKFDKHLEIYANNGKELAAVKTNQAWLMKFFWLLMTPTISGIVYLVIHI